MELNHKKMEAIEMKKQRVKMLDGKQAVVLAALFALVLVLPGLVLANPMIHNSANLGSTYWGGNWGVTGGQYGAFDCGTCHARNTGNIKRVKKDLIAPNSPGEQFPIEGSGIQVNFMDVREGSSDFGDDSNAGRIADGVTDTTSDKVCEACHTQTKFHNYDATLNAGNGGDRDHYNDADCMVCHPHNQGFKPLDCTACHGYPPTTTDNDGSTTTGLTHNPFITGSSIVGAHVMHATTLSYACENCHDGYTMPQNSTAPGLESQGDVSIGFNNFGSVTGSYSGQTGVSYNHVEGDNSVTCSTVYCHGSTLDGTDTTPTWSAAGVNCGDCHRGTNAAMDNAAALGSHQMHAGSGAGQLNLACSKCHASPGASGHVSGLVEWSLDTADSKFGASAAYNGSASANSGSRAPSGAYSNCSNIYCHSPGQNASGGALAGGDYATPTWGGTVNCGDCHATTTLASGSHNAHLTFTGSAIGCDECHTGAASDASSYASAQHIDETIDVAHTYTQGASHVPANGYGDCSATVCHGNNTPTWGGAALNCAGCHGANNTMPNSHGSHYDNATLADATDLTPANNTSATNYEFSCGVCHDSATHVGGNVSGNQAAEVLFNAAIAGGSASYSPGALAGNDNGFNYTGGTCNTNNCHDDGLGSGPNTAPVWGAAAMGCGDCHDALPATNAHTTHINDGTIMANITCDACHNVTAANNTTINDKRQHVDQTKDVDIDATYGGSFATGDCSNVYCHSDGQATPTYNTVTWSSTITGCVECHEGATAGTSLTGAHEAHIVNATATIGADLTCNQCHSVTATNNTAIATPAQHVDGGVDVDSCATQYCHSDGNAGNLVYNSPTFASDTYDCTTCHGNGTDQSYPSYADGGAGTVDSNSHNAHVGTSLISCEECHADTSVSGNAIDGATPAQHVDGGIDVVFKQTGSYDDTANNDTCSTTYCHGAGTPQWGDVGSLNCGSCHSANSSLADSHGVHYNTGTLATAINANNDSTVGNYIFQCGNCHNATAHAGGAVSANQAAEVSLSGSGTYTADGVQAGTDNGFDYTAGTCSTNDCHNDGTAAKGNANFTAASLQWSVTTLPADCTGCHDNNAAAAQTMATNAHAAHINDGTIMTDKACNVCHTATVDGTDRAIINKTVHINGAQNVDIIAAYDNDATPGNNWDGTNCSNVYCHSDGKATPNYATAKDWTTAIGDCTSCHGGANGSNGGTGTAASALTASHTVHTGAFGYTCDDCHVQTASSNSAISTAANHVNQSADVAVAVANGGDGNIDGNYTAATESCATTLCHGTGDVDVKWLAAEPAGQTTGDCSLCHGMEANPADVRDTSGATAATDAQVGAHAIHLNPNFSRAVTCDQCHLTTVTNQTAAGTYVGKVNAAGHIDTAGPAELTWGGVADGNDDGQATPAPVSCNTVYCHDASKIKNNWGGADTTGFAWDNPNFIDPEGDSTYVGVGDCDSCHGYPPAGGHVANNDCSACHDVLNADDITFTAAGKLTHVDGIVQASGGDNCSDCHTSLSGDHNDHTDWGFFLAGKTVSAGDYGKAAASGTNSIGWYDVRYNASGLPIIGCGQCHPEGEGASHPTAGLNIDLDGSDELASLPDPNPKRNNNGVNWGANTCSGVYCHSDGINDGVYPDSPVWGTDTITDCKGCHDNSPSVGPSGSSHGVHVVGIHYRTLYDGNNTLMTEGAASNAAHGDSGTSTTMTCNTCHAFTIDTNSNVGNNTCGTCHTPGAGPGDQTMTIAANSTAHINGAATVWFNSATFKTRAQLRGDTLAGGTEYGDSWTRNNGYKAGATSHDDDKSDKNADAGAGRWWIYNSGSKTCSTVDCHNGLTTPSWDTGSTMNCAACHTSVPQ